VPLAKMKMKQLSDELAARGAPKSGPRKRVLQLRLRALIIRARRPRRTRRPPRRRLRDGASGCTRENFTGW